MTEVTLKRTGLRPIKFTGERLADVSTSSDRSHPDYSGMLGISNKVEVWRTNSKKFVLRIDTYTQFQGSTDTYTVEVLDTIQDLVEHVEELPSRVSTRVLRQLEEEGLEIAEVI